MYVNHPDDVEPNPPELVDNQGFECTEVAVDECINVLQALGYGGRNTPTEIMAAKVNFRTYILFTVSSQ